MAAGGGKHHGGGGKHLAAAASIMVAASIWRWRQASWGRQAFWRGGRHHGHVNVNRNVRWAVRPVRVWSQTSLLRPGHRRCRTRHDHRGGRDWLGSPGSGPEHVLVLGRSQPEPRLLGLLRRPVGDPEVSIRGRAARVIVCGPVISIRISGRLDEGTNCRAEWPLSSCRPPAPSYNSTLLFASDSHFMAARPAKKTAKKPVAIIMGSQSDWATMQHAAETLDALGIGYEALIVSAHRTPDRLFAFAKRRAEEGLQGHHRRRRRRRPSARHDGVADRRCRCSACR